MQVSSSGSVQSSLSAAQVKRSPDAVKSFDQVLSDQVTLSDGAQKASPAPGAPSSVLSSAEKDFFNALYEERVGRFGVSRGSLYRLQCRHSAESGRKKFFPEDPCPHQRGDIRQECLICKWFRHGSQSEQTGMIFRIRHTRSGHKNFRSSPFGELLFYAFPSTEASSAA